MADKEAAKQRILSLISLDKRKIDSMDEDTLMKTITDVDEVRQEAVKDGRFLGWLTRRRECEAEAQTAQGVAEQAEEERR